MPVGRYIGPVTQLHDHQRQPKLILRRAPEMQTRTQTVWQDSKAQVNFTVAQNALTLVELLVVIAVLLVLASLLLPAISRGKAGSHAAKCQSNLRQIVIATTLYTSDFHSLPRLFSANLAKNTFLAGSAGPVHFQHVVGSALSMPRLSKDQLSRQTKSWLFHNANWQLRHEC